MKIIEPDGQFIKKEQILELKHYFSKSSIFTKENVYIIKNCEKMNKESANTMLKFLEEPDSSVIGFFITDHVDNVINTIVSRCQHIDAIFRNNIYEELNISDEKYNTFLHIINTYLYSIEVEKKNSILDNRKYLSELEKSDIITIFQIVLKIYLSLLNKNLGDFPDFEYLKSGNSNKNRKKVKLIIEILNELQYNVNLEMILDRFILEMEGINNETI